MPMGAGPTDPTRSRDGWTLRKSHPAVPITTTPAVSILTPRARALAYWQRVRDALPPAELAAIRRRGGGADFDAPPIDCRALEVEPDLWEFYRVVRTPSDMPNTERWEFRYCAPMLYEQPGRYYMPIGSTAEDVWRRHFPRTLDQLVIIDSA